MPEDDLATLVEYAKKRMLPGRRLEVMIARLCMYMDAYMGGRKNAALADYLLDPKEEVELDEDDAKAYFGFNPK